MNHTVADLERLLLEAEARTRKAAEVVMECEVALLQARREWVACADTEYGLRVDLYNMRKTVKP
jgi:hypothetical protein